MFGKASESVLLAVLLFGFTSLSQAQEDIVVKQDGYEVFYSAFNTSFISPEVAAAAGIVRGKNKGLVNISAIRYNDAGERLPIELESIEGDAYDLVYRNQLEFKEIVEPGARYYLAPFKISADNEFIQFDITVVPRSQSDSDASSKSRPIAIKFKRRFFID